MVKGGVYTFAGVVENHAGMQKIGVERDGLNKEDLKVIGAYFKEHGYEPTGIKLHNLTPGKQKKAYVLIVRRGSRAFGLKKNELFEEMKSVNPDKKFLNTRRKQVQNKNARWNFNVADFEQAPSYEEGKGTVVSFENLQSLKKIREGLNEIGIPKIQNLLAEANVYHSEMSGIGFHGDSERKMVVGVNMGAKRVIEFQAFEHTLPVGKRLRIHLRDGDMYFMCTVACGNDWTSNGYRSLHYRHRAGYQKWLDRNERQNQTKWNKRKSSTTFQRRTKKRKI